MRTLLSLFVATLFVATLLVLGGLTLAAPLAHANGILVVGDVAQPLAPDRRERFVRVSPVRLKGHQVSAQLQDRVAEVTVEQVFHNDSGAQLEGTYLFPLPEGAVVSQFAMTMAGKLVEGEILEANKAREIYESIVRRRRDPGLLEYMGRGLFRARVFPIEPHKDLTIKLTFQQVLAEDAGTLEFRYPLATDRLNGTPVEKVLVDVKIDSSVDIKAIYSPTHTVEILRNGERKARVTYERSDRKQDKDLLLYVGRSPDAVGFSFLSHKAPGEDGTFMAVLAPRVEVKPGEHVAKDVVYVLDTSGSMAGPKMEQARAALAYGVRSLAEKDRFNIIGFSTGLHPFRDTMLEASAEMKESAAAWIERLQAAGGTNIEGALLAALAMHSEGRLFLVVFITDGRPTVGERDAEALVKQITAANVSKARVFTFGVGYDLDVGLLDRIAELSNGARDYVTPGEDIEIVTGRFFNKVGSPVLSDVKVEFGAGVYDVYPQKLPDLFAGGQVVVFGRYREAGDRLIRLSGAVGGQASVHEYEATLRRAEGSGFLPRLWAHRKVAFLLDEIRLHGENKELVEEVVKLAVRFAIVTPYTAGLVVEETELEGRLPPAAQARRLSGLDRDGGGPWTSGGAGGGGGQPASGRGGAGALPPPTTPGAPSAGAATPAPSREADASKDLRKRKEGLAHGDEDDFKALREKIATVGEKTFMLRKDGRWTDTTWDGKRETTKVEVFSKAYFELLEQGEQVAKFLALGERVVFVLGEAVYEIVPAPSEGK